MHTYSAPYIKLAFDAQINDLTLSNNSAILFTNKFSYTTRRITMSYVPDYEEAYALLQKYNKDEFHLKHGRIVSGVLGYFAAELDPEQIEFWKIVGLLHDLDFELYPDEHCIKVQEIMKELDFDEKLIHAVASHGYDITVNIKPEHIMEKVLYATDELTGLIGAVAIMRPSKSVSDLEVKSVKKKFKALNFAAGCSREVIQNGADMLEWELTELIEKTILAMRSLISDTELL
jgi:Predicted hydrolase (HD superfamily)